MKSAFKSDSESLFQIHAASLPHLGLMFHFKGFFPGYVGIF
uniref:Uncharacterized protein n=1 Tax=Anguilla anguilla TaxID=7936 RepID=A0A0E9UQL2_ANGAN